MNQYYKKYYEMAEEFNLEFKFSGFVCTLPNVHPLDYVMKFDNKKKVIYVAEKLIDDGQYICCCAATELRPKLARQQLAKLMCQYKEILSKRKLKLIEKKLKTIEKDFE